MKIVIIGAGSIAFTPAILSGFSADRRYRGATIGLVDVEQAALDLVASFARRVTDELGLSWQIQASTDRREVLKDADVVTTSIGVGGLAAWEMDVDIPFKYGIIQPVGDTSGPGGLGRALRHIPVLVEIAQDMEQLCPKALFYNFSNPLTVLTQAVNKLTKIPCIGLCIGVDLTWEHVCRLVGVEKKETSILAGGINHCHWIYDFRVRGEDAMPRLSAALERSDEGQPLCAALFRRFGAYPGPGDGHVGEFFPQLMKPLIKDLGTFQGHAIRNVRQTYPPLWEKMKAISGGETPIDTEDFARELAWEHTQFLDIMVSRLDNLGQTFYINIPNRGIVTNLPQEAVVEIPATVDASGVHPFALGDLPEAVVPTLAHKLSSLNLIIEAAMEGSREKALQATINDPHCTDIDTMAKVVDELIEAERAYLPRFQS